MTRVLMLDATGELRAFTEALRSADYDVLILDNQWRLLHEVVVRDAHVIVLPYAIVVSDGEEFLTLMRRITDAALIIVGEEGEAATVRALLGGADLYVPVSLDLHGFVTMVRALIRRKGTDMAGEMNSGTFGGVWGPLMGTGLLRGLGRDTAFPQPIGTDTLVDACIRQVWRVFSHLITIDRIVVRAGLALVSGVARVSQAYRYFN